jgi:putative ABC transport system ATP-binding protein
MNLITAQQLAKSYPSGSGMLHALQGVTFTVAPGEFVAVMGPSGSGKTTLMNLIGLLDRPSGGQLLIEDEDVTQLGPDRQAAIRNSRIGFVFQSYNLLARSTAIENVELPLVYAGLPKHERRSRAAALLDAFGLADRQHHWPAQLSGGEQQRVAIARAMVTDPSLILADEPTGALDTTTGRAVLALFQALNEQGKAIVMITHDEAVARHARRVLRLKDGRLVADAPVADRAIAGAAS